MHPSLTLIAHDPLFAVIRVIEIDLVAVQAISLFAVLLHAFWTQILSIIFMT